MTFADATAHSVLMGASFSVGDHIVLPVIGAEGWQNINAGVYAKPQRREWRW